MKDKIKIIGYLFYDVYGWCRSLLVYVFASIKHPSVFYGYCAYYWASKFADRRTACWKPKWDQSGKQQGVFPIGDVKLIVCSKLELKLFKKKGIVSKNFKPRKAIKKSYYTTEL